MNSTPRDLLACVSLLFLGGCYTPAGQLTDQDFVAQAVVVDRAMPHVQSAFYEGLRTCGPKDRVFLTSKYYGIAECGPVRPDGVAVCDIYQPGGIHGRLGVMGRIDFAPLSSDRTSVIIRVRSSYADKASYFSDWEKLARGKVEEVCKSQ